MTRQLKNLVGGEWVDPRGAETWRIVNPADGKTVVATTRPSTAEDVAAAVTAAAEAFPAWRATPVHRRCRILFHIKELLEQNLDELAEIIVAENGKTLQEAQGDVRRGIEVVEFAAGMPSLSKGDFIEDIATRVDGYIYREPLGVCVGACPFNFPAMVPLWMYPVAIACGNTFVLKPSDKCPATATRVAEIMLAGGLPPGVLNVVQGARETFEAMITSHQVRAVSFVGSTPAALNVWQLGTSHHKRVQSLGGAKNHIIVMPDADRQATVKGVIGSAFDCAGQRCMACSVLVLVGEARTWLDDFVAAAKALRVGAGMDPATDMGPVVSAAAKQRIAQCIRDAEAEGAKIVLDGRGLKVEGLEGGFFLGPTILDGVRPEMKTTQTEIFGPVLSVMYAESLDEAIDLANRSPYGNGHSIFTSSGGAARHFRNRIACGMLGINAGVPAPMAFFSFGGHKRSLFGDLRLQGTDGVEFYTQKKSVIERWYGIGRTGSVWGRG